MSKHSLMTNNNEITENNKNNEIFTWKSLILTTTYAAQCHMSET